LEGNGMIGADDRALAQGWTAKVHPLTDLIGRPMR